jgi:hypothetical protein
MKAKRFALIALAVAAFTGGASAQTVIRITGSTAFRSATNASIGNILEPGYTFGYTGSTFSGSNRTIFTGTTKAPTSTPVVIKCQWSGAVGGVGTIVNNVALPEWLVNGSPQSTGGTQITTPAYDVPVTADIAMADGFQNTTQYKSPVMVANVVGVLPFQWFRNHGSPTTLDNMNPLLAASLLSGGLPLSQFTGNPADAGVAVYGTGRNEDSGTRMVTYADCFFGVFSSPLQYQPIISGGTVTDLVPWPPATVLGTPYPLGHSGFDGGGQLVTAMNTPGSNTTSANPGHLVAYAGINDAQGALPGTAATATATVDTTPGPVTAITVTNGGTNYGSGTFVTITGGGGSGATAVPVLSGGVVTGITLTNGGSGYTSAPTVAIRGGATLKYNGYDYSANSVREGKYTFWSYQILMHRPGYANAAIATQLANRIKTVDASISGILLSTMNVGRAVEGGPVTPGNPYP